MKNPFPNTNFFFHFLIIALPVMAVAFLGYIQIVRLSFFDDVTLSPSRQRSQLAAIVNIALPNLQPGQWYEIPNSRLNQSGVFPPSPAPPGNPSAVMTAWNGAAYDSKRERLIIHGGGHGDYAGNEIYVFDMNTFKWSRPWGPSTNSDIPPSAAEADVYYDGNPASVHSYDGLIYIASRDKFWRGGGSKWSGSGGGTRASWFFDFNTLNWQRLANSNPAVVGVSVVSDYDPVTDRIFTYHDRGQVGEYNPNDNTWRYLSSVVPAEEPNAAIDPVRRIFVGVGNGRFNVFNLTTGLSTQPSTSGPQNVVNCRGPGFLYDPVIKQFVGWCGGTSVYSLNPDNWTWTEYPAAGSNTTTPAGDPTRLLAFSKFNYIPSSNLYIAVSAVGSSVYLYKLSSGSNTPPPSTDATPPTVSITSPLSGATVSGTITVSANASDNIGVAGVQFKLDGTNLGSEDTASPYSVSWNTTLSSNASHALTATARDQAGNQGTSPSITVTVNNGAPSPGVINVPPGGSVPLRQWAERPMPGAGLAYMGGVGGKHGRAFYHPGLKGMVFAGGDAKTSQPQYEGYGDGTGSEVWTLNAQTDKFTLLRPFCVASENQPGWPDSVNWTYDSRRDRGIMAPGFYFITQGAKDPCGSNMGWGGYAFDFATKKWNGPDGVVNLPPPPNGWGGDGGSSHAVYDPVNDEFVRIRNSPQMERLNLSTQTWRVQQLRLQPTWNPNPNRAELVIDVNGRAVYWLDAFGDKGGTCCGGTWPARGPALIRVSLVDVSVSVILLPSQYVPAPSDSDVYLAFDPVNRVVLVPNNIGMGQSPIQGLGIYRVDTGQWEWEAVPQAVWGSVWGFDENIGAMIGIGKRTSPTAYYMYKYGPGGTTLPPPTSDTTPPSGAVTLSASSATVTNGQSSVLTLFLPTLDYHNIFINNVRPTCAPSGTTQTCTLTVSPTTSTNYQATATNAAGTPYTMPNVTVTVGSTTPPPPAPSTKFSINDRVQTAAILNVRSTPSTSGVLLGAQPLGALGTVIGGPTNANGYDWWNINYDNAPDGWSVENFLNKVTLIPTLTLSANPTSVASGQSSSLTWSSTSATSCTASNGWSGTKSISGTQVISPVTTTTTYTLSCTDTGGSATQSVTVTVTSTPDTTAPSTPTNLSAAAVSQSQINLSWAASTDNIGVAGYKIFRAGTQIGTATINSYSDTSLTANTTYSYTVSAYDVAGNTSLQSSSVSATTQSPAILTCAPSTQTLQINLPVAFTVTGGSPPYAWSAPNGAPVSGSGASFSTTYVNPGTYTVTTTNGTQTASCSVTVTAPPPSTDTNPPSAPATLTAVVVSASQISMSWRVSVDDVGVTGYKLYRNGIAIATSPSLNYADSNLSPETSYTYTVSAYDLAGNTSSQSNAVTLTTLPPALPLVFPVTPLVPPTPVFQTPLYLSLRHPEVTTLQRLLISRGLLLSGNDTGFYGPLTQEAVKKFQCEQGIVCGGKPEDTGYGLVGPRTRERLNQIGLTSSPQAALPSVLTESQRRALIQQLTEQIKQLQIQLLQLQLKLLQEQLDSRI